MLKQLFYHIFVQSSAQILSKDELLPLDKEEDTGSGSLAGKVESLEYTINEMDKGNLRDLVDAVAQLTAGIGKVTQNLGKDTQSTTTVVHSGAGQTDMSWLKTRVYLLSMSNDQLNKTMIRFHKKMRFYVDDTIDELKV